VPLGSEIQRCPSYCNVTRDECVTLINQVMPNLEATRRFTLDWLKDVAFTLQPANPIFFPNRVRPHGYIHHDPEDKERQERNKLLSETKISVPAELLDNIVNSRKCRYKRGYLANCIKIMQTLGSIPSGELETESQYRQQLLLRGVHRPCIICMSNIGPLLYTVCCGHPMHLICNQPIVDRCPMCRIMGHPMLSLNMKVLERAMKLPQVQTN